MIEDLKTKDTLTLAEIQQITGYSNTVTAYQILRNRHVKPVGKRKNPLGGGDINEYDTATVLTVLGQRIEAHRLKSLAPQK